MTTAQVLRNKKDAIVAAFEKRIREHIPRVRDISHSELVNHVPEYLDAIINHLDKKIISEEEMVAERKSSRKHGRDRSHLRGYGVETLLAEYRHLRIVMFNYIEADGPIPKEDRDAILDMIQLGAKHATIQFLFDKASNPGILKYAAATSWGRYAVSAILILIATYLQWVSKSLTGPAPYIIYYPAVLLAAVFGDGILATILAAFLGQFLFSKANASWTFVWPDDYFRTLLFLVNATIIASIAKLLRAAKENANIVAEEQELAKKELEVTINKLQDEKFLREQFVTSLTHDLRGPLTSIKISAQQLLKNSKIDTPERIYNRIIGSAERADEMIQDLLDVSLIRSGQEIPMTTELCNLNDICLDVIEEFRSIYGDRFIFTYPETITGYWSYNGIKRIIENLVTNAIKYGAPEKPIEIAIDRKGTMASIRIHNFLLDRPLSSEEIEYLFEPFQRSKKAKSSGKSGWGLGLTLVKGLVHSHKGSIEVESSAETGTVFKITMPIASPQ
jgi:signal transduction histidine kinase